MKYMKGKEEDWKSYTGVEKNTAACKPRMSEGCSKVYFELIHLRSNPTLDGKRIIFCQEESGQGR